MSTQFIQIHLKILLNQDGIVVYQEDIVMEDLTWLMMLKNGGITLIKNLI